MCNVKLRIKFLLWIFITHSSTSGERLENYVTNRFSPPGAVMNHLVVDEKLNFVYVAAENSLYQLDKNLSTIVNAPTGPVSDDVECIPFSSTCTDSKANNTNKLLLIDKKGQRLITCGNVYQGACETRMLSNVSQVLFDINQDGATEKAYRVACNTKKGSTVGIIAEGPTLNDSVLYVAVSKTVGVFSESASISTHSLHFDPDRENQLFKYAISVEQGNDGSVLTIPVDDDLEFKYIFETGAADGFIYYVLTRKPSTSGASTSQGKENVIARICKSEILYHSYVELPVDCGKRKPRQPSTISGAYYAPDGNNDGTLYILFTYETHSSVCSFSIQSLSKLFFDTVEICYQYNGKSADGILVDTIDPKSEHCYEKVLPDTWLRKSNTTLNDPIVRPVDVTLDYYPTYESPKTQVLCGAQYLPNHLTRLDYTNGKLLFQKSKSKFTTITTNRVLGRTVGLIGSKDGSIFQVNFDTGVEFNRIPVGQEILPSFVWDQNPNADVPHLYVTTAPEILRIRVAACEQHMTCNACKDSRNPYCGWCILEKRCSTKKECKTALRDQNRWLSSESEQCIDAKSPAPKERTLSDEVAVSVNLLPVLELHELYECVFDGRNPFEAKIQHIEGKVTNILCQTPSDNELPPSLINEDYVNVTLSVRYKTVDIASTVMTFYECDVYGTRLEANRPCAGCLASRRQCRWCLNQNKCKPQLREEGCIDDQHVCPTILSVSPQDKLISVGKPHAITLTAKNLPKGGTYTCKIGFGRSSRPVIVAASLSPSGAEISCQEYNYTYSTDSYEVEAYITVRWKLTFVVDYEREENSTITFYKCSAKRNDCSRCVTADPKYDCGWCESTKLCTIQDSCSTSKWVTDPGRCPAHEILNVIPKSGPRAGGTPVRIIGTDMGTKANDVQKVTIGDRPCTIDNSRYQISVEVVCTTSAVESEKQAKVKVTVKNITKIYSGFFQFRDPVLQDVMPKIGPKAGGTMIRISGKNLDTGSLPVVWIGHSPRINCVVNPLRTPSTLNCTTGGSQNAISCLDISVQFDGFTTKLTGKYCYTENPEVKGYYTLTPNKLSSFLSGGRSVYVKGTNFNSVQSPYLMATMLLGRTRRRRTSNEMLRQIFIRAKKSRATRQVSDGYLLPGYVYSQGYASTCNVANGTFMMCYSPKINITTSGMDRLSTNFSDTLFWSARLVLHMDNQHDELERPLLYYPDPEFVKFGKVKDKRGNALLSITVYNLKGDAITRDEIDIQVGTKRCNVASIDGDKLLCTIPNHQGEKGEEYDVTVKIGHGNDPIQLGVMTYYVDPPPISQTAVIAIIVVGIVILAFVVGTVVYFAVKNKNYKADKNDFQKAMENLEMSVRADFRKAFAELNVDMSDLTADIGDYGIPCLDYRTYVTNLFFPSFKYHPCTKAPNPDTQFPVNLEQGLTQFHRLLSNRNFLTVFIHTLEEQKGFSNRDKGNVASLLTVALHGELDYFTEIMKSLVLDLISVNVQRNPKLILRRSDSIAERMLSNWMYICLYPYLRNKAGGPIFLLLKAIKQQVSKGPLDAITGKARYTLSDDRLLQEDVENETLTLFIAPNSKSDDEEGEPVIVKVLSCDSVAQVKEKVMDAVYKRVPFSQRPKPEQLDIEWRHGRSGHLVLPNQDYSSEPGSRWRRLMTIVDYKVANNATLALIPRQQEQEGSQDMSMSNRSTDTSPLSPMLPEDGTTKTYHLVKYNDDIEAKRESTIPRDRHKHIAELYLLRLLNMKGILQNYVDAVFQAILDKSFIPCPVKHFFHFLDEIASKHGITDAEILHIWKTNSLLGRFWVTILKNPESVFDVEKPDSISSSMAVISQTFIDACSVNEHRPTKDSPINKQLYAKEIPNYKKMVQEYYKVVKEQPATSDQDVNAYIAEISREHGCKFDVPVAVKELWGYLNKYYEEVNESLENDVNISPAVIQRLQQTYNLIDTAANNGG